MYKVPIVIFAYNRPTHFKRVMIALENSKIKSNQHQSIKENIWTIDAIS